MIWGIIGIGASIAVGFVFYWLGKRDGKQTVRDIVTALKRPEQKQKQLDHPIQEALQAKYPGYNFSEQMQQDMIAEATTVVLSSVDSMLDQSTVFQLWEDGEELK